MEVLTWLYSSQGKLAEAEQMAVKVLEDRQRLMGAEHYETRRIRGELVGIYLRQGKLYEAEQALRQAPSAANTQFSDPWVFAAQFGELAAAFEQTGQFNKAEEAYRETRFLSEGVLAKFPDRPWSQNKMAWFLATCPPSPDSETPLAPSNSPEGRSRRHRVRDPSETRWVWLCPAPVTGERPSRRSRSRCSSATAATPLTGSSWRWPIGSLETGTRPAPWYDRAVEWMDKNRSSDHELKHFRAEAATLLGRTKLPAHVFDRP